MIEDVLSRRPLVIALAGPNGAGKSSFYRAYLQNAGLHFVNADNIAKEAGLDAYKAAALADRMRRDLVAMRESFIFETVFSDPVGDKLKFLKEAEALGYTAVLLYIGIPTPQFSDERVSIRVSKGGHDVPREKLVERFPRILKNLQRALGQLSNVRVYDNSEFARPYRMLFIKEDGKQSRVYPPTPSWLKPLLP